MQTADAPKYHRLPLGATLALSNSGARRGGGLSEADTLLLCAGVASLVQIASLVAARSARARAPPALSLSLSGRRS